MTVSKIPHRTVLECNPPVIFASRLALREGNYKKPIYQIHKWWARRIGSVFRMLLLSATRPAEESKALGNGLFYQKHDLSGLVVLDPFVGGGTSVVEAAKCNANIIGVDIDPVACFITAKELSSFDKDELLSAFRSVEEQVKNNILSWYRTKLSDGREGTAIYMFWVDQITCPECKAEVPGHTHYQLNRDHRKKQQVAFCSICNEVSILPLNQNTLQCKACNNQTNIKLGPIKRLIFTCPSCKTTTHIRSLVSKNKPVPQKLFALEVLVDGTNERVFKKADSEDLVLYERAHLEWVHRRKFDKFVPSEQIPVKDREDPRPICDGYQRYRDLFNSRQLLCLSLIAESIASIKDVNSREYLALAFSDCLASNNMFCFYAFDYQKLTPLFGLHAYTKVNRPVENNVWGIDIGRGSFEKCFNKLIRGKLYGREPFEFRYRDANSKPERVYTGDKINSEIYQRLPRRRGKKEPFAVVRNQPSERLVNIQTGSVDLILTDPPYYDNLPYSELSDFYHVWLKRLNLKSYAGSQHSQTPLSKSLYVRRDPTRLSKDHKRFANGLTKVFTECNRVLKDSGLLVFTFHHNDSKAWSALAAALVKSSFRITNVFPVRSEGQSQFHSAERNIKWDVVFCCRKSNQEVMSLQGRDAEHLRSKMWSDSKENACIWKQELDKESLHFSKADATSLQRGFLTMYLSQSGLDVKDYSTFFLEKEVPHVQGNCTR